jgi:hypothetical protein
MLSPTARELLLVVGGQHSMACVQWLEALQWRVTWCTVQAYTGQHLTFVFTAAPPHHNAGTVPHDKPETANKVQAGQTTRFDGNKVIVMP